MLGIGLASISISLLKDKQEEKYNSSFGGKKNEKL